MQIKLSKIPYKLKNALTIALIAGTSFACSKDENSEPVVEPKVETIMWGMDNFDRLHPDTIRQTLNRPGVSNVILENDGKSLEGMSATRLCTAALDNAFAVDPKRVESGKTALVDVQVTTAQHKIDSTKMSDVYRIKFAKMYQKQK